MSSLTEKKNSLFGKAPPATAGHASSGSPPAAPAPPVPPVPRADNVPISLTGGVLSPQMKMKRIEEAKSYSEAATNHLKTSMFKWSVDYLAAAPLFEKSAESYALANEFDMARLMYEKGAQAHEAYGSLSSAAMAFVKAAKIASQKQKLCAQAAKHYESASYYWGINGDIERAADYLGKAAKELEGEDLAGAGELYGKACDMLCPSETRPDEMGQCPVIALEMFRSYFRCLVLLKGPHESLIPVANRMIDLFQGFGSESSLCKMMLTVTLLELHGGDVVRAEQTYLNSHLNNPVYIKSKECEVADLYVLAFKRQDITKLDEAKGHMQLNYLDAEIQAIARNLSLFRTRPDYNPHDPHINEIHVAKPPQTESTPINNDTAAAADSESGDQHEEEGEELEGGQYGMAGVTSYVHQEYDPEIYEDEIDLS